MSKWRCRVDSKGCVSYSQEKWTLWTLPIHSLDKLCNGSDSECMAQSRQWDTRIPELDGLYSVCTPRSILHPQVHSGPHHVRETDPPWAGSWLLVIWLLVGFARWDALPGDGRRNCGAMSSLAFPVPAPISDGDYKALVLYTLSTDSVLPGSHKTIASPAPSVLSVGSAFLMFLIPGFSITPCRFSSFCLRLYKQSLNSLSPKKYYLRVASLSI